MMNQFMSSLGYKIFKILTNFEIVFVQRKGTRIFFCVKSQTCTYLNDFQVMVHYTLGLLLRSLCYLTRPHGDTDK